MAKQRPKNIFAVLGCDKWLTPKQQEYSRQMAALLADESVPDEVKDRFIQSAVRHIQRKWSAYERSTRVVAKTPELEMPTAAEPPKRRGKGRSE